MVRLQRKRVVVNLVDGTAITGERLFSWPWSMRVGGAQLLAPNMEPRRIDGVAVIPRRAVIFAQILD